jgi:hypothetical protein
MITDTTIAIKPQINAVNVLGNDLVQSLKLQLKSISGIANGTVIFINQSCSVRISTLSDGDGNNPLKAITIPTR